jgi:hypothetical protein
MSGTDPAEPQRFDKVLGYRSGRGFQDRRRQGGRRRAYQEVFTACLITRSTGLPEGLYRGAHQCHP